MRFKRRMRIELDLKQIEITPLIDCVFLLLIFFMLTSNFIVVHGINIKLPKTESKDSIEQDSATITVSSEDIVYIRDEVYTYAELGEYLKDSRHKSIFIKADKEASLGAVAGIWDICRQRGIEKIGIATLGAQK